MLNMPKSIQKSCCNAENKKCHCEPQAWQSHRANTDKRDSHVSRSGFLGMTIPVFIIALLLCFGTAIKAYAAQCPAGYYFNGTSCVVCDPCGHYCPGDDDIYTCPYGTYAESGAVKCIENTASGCSRKDNCHKGCSSCNDGYYFDSGNCVENNIPNCRWQSSSTDCASCEDGYYFNGSTCVKNDMPNCKNQRGVDCFECNDGYYVDSGNCVENNIPNCRLQSSSTYCAFCEDGYYFNGSTCVENDIPHCLRQNSISCDYCEDGYYFSYDTGVCVENTAVNCKTKSPWSNECQTCNDGYYPKDSACVENDIPNCKIQYGSSGCSKCDDGYTWYNDTQKCDIQTFPHCRTAGSWGCNQCDDGYYIDGLYPARCFKNPIGCKVKLTGSTDCSECYDGFHLDYSGYPAMCVENSLGCKNQDTSSGKCSSCFDGYNLVDGTCVRNTPSSCGAGQYLDGSECKTCPAGTFAEAGDNVCSVCGSHEYSAAGASSCTPRQNFSNCNEFSTDSDECTSCKTGYTAENGGCVSMCSDGKVFWDGECYDEYPFAKKRYTPAEADQWLKDDGNIVTLIFKK